MQFFLYNICCFNKIHAADFPLSLSTIIQNFKHLNPRLNYNNFFKFKMAAVRHLGFSKIWFLSTGTRALHGPGGPIGPGRAVKFLTKIGPGRVVMHFVSYWHYSVLVLVLPLQWSWLQDWKRTTNLTVSGLWFQPFWPRCLPVWHPHNKLLYIRHWFSHALYVQFLCDFLTSSCFRTQVASIQPAANELGPKYVVILSYQRCGSTFFGNVFNLSPDAFYSYEPLDSLYSSLYGTAFGWNVPSDITNHANGTARWGSR